MAEAASAVPTPLFHGLPDEISIWEILVRLSPKDLLRCRAVCPAWRRATSIHDFLLAHHACQPTLPLILSFRSPGVPLDIIPFDHPSGLTAADQLHSVARIDSGDAYTLLDASCDGLLILSFNSRRFWICNLATRECAPLPLPHGFEVVGMYLHPPTGEYRLLVCNDLDVIDGEHAYHVSTLGSHQPPRHVGFQDFTSESFLFHGSLHCCIGQMIIVFDTIAELFRQMRSLIVYDVLEDADALFEMGDMLSVYKVNDDAATSIDIWVLEDYRSEVWAFKCRVELPVDELRVQFGMSYGRGQVVVSSFDGDLLVLARFGDCLLQIDSDGKLVASFHRRDIYPSRIQLKQTLVRHSFFPALEGYVVNASPFI